MILLSIGLAGGLGAVFRYLIDQNLYSDSSFPVSTLSINCLGSFLIGILFVISTEKGLSKEVALILGTGFLGGFTTFSAYALQTLNLAKDGNFSVAALYFVGSPLAALVAVFLGYGLGRMAV